LTNRGKAVWSASERRGAVADDARTRGTRRTDSARKSDSAIVAGKSANKAERLAAEPTERRAGAKGNVDQQITCRAQNRESVSQALERIRQAARQRKKERFTSLLHHINVDLLRLAFFELKRNAAPGVDGLTWQDYEADLELRLVDLHARVQRGAYRALPSRRRYIPKADGRQRPLAVAALEDKIVQRAVVAVLNAIYEEDFLGSRTGSDQSADSTMRWMPLLSGSPPKR
jgi:RNA-directed DNA polymerase